MKAKRNGQLVMSYRYNGKGEQIQRFIGQSSTNSLFDEQGHWLGDYDNAGKPKQQAIWLGDLPVAVVGSNSPVGTAASMDQTLAYIETDHLNTPRVAINPERNVAIWRWDIQADLVTVNRTKTPTTTASSSPSTCVSLASATTAPQDSTKMTSAMMTPKLGGLSSLTRLA